MQQRQLRLGDILDDYCPRERRVTNHAVVAMIGDEVKQTRCATCDTEHEYKHAKVPRQRRKNEAPAALYAQVAAGAPKRVASAPLDPDAPLDQQAPDEPMKEAILVGESNVESKAAEVEHAEQGAGQEAGEHAEPDSDERDDQPQDDGPVHRPLIRASLPRPEGQQPPARPIPEFTIRQPAGGRPSRFRPRHQREGQGHQFQGNRSNGNMGGPMRGPRPNSARTGMKRHGPGGGRKRSK